MRSVRGEHNGLVGGERKRVQNALSIRRVQTVLLLGDKDHQFIGRKPEQDGREQRIIAVDEVLQLDDGGLILADEFIFR